MWRLLFLSSISGVLASGCGDDCGPGDAPAFGLVASSADVTLTYGNFTSGVNNDCPDPMAPEGVISLTLEGTQKDAATTQLIVMCMPRPDLLATMDQPINTGLRIIDVNGEANGCTFKYDSSRVATGMVHSRGLCDNGTNDNGYAIGITGNVSLRRTCGTTIDSVAVELSGMVAVKQKQL
jgi:hypothetical protein